MLTATDLVVSTFKKWRTRREWLSLLGLWRESTAVAASACCFWRHTANIQLSSWSVGKKAGKCYWLCFNVSKLNTQLFFNAPCLSLQTFFWLYVQYIPKHLSTIKLNGNDSLSLFLYVYVKKLRKSLFNQRGDSQKWGGNFEFLRHLIPLGLN